jgi:hypothetical protein
VHHNDHQMDFVPLLATQLPRNNPWIRQFRRDLAYVENLSPTPPIPSRILGRSGIGQKNGWTQQMMILFLNRADLLFPLFFPLANTLEVKRNYITEMMSQDHGSEPSILLRCHYHAHNT